MGDWYNKIDLSTWKTFIYSKFGKQTIVKEMILK